MHLCLDQVKPEVSLRAHALQLTLSQSYVLTDRTWPDQSAHLLSPFQAALELPHKWLFQLAPELEAVFFLLQTHLQSQPAYWLET